MSTTLLFAELLIIGLQVTIWFALLIVDIWGYDWLSAIQTIGLSDYMRLNPRALYLNQELLVKREKNVMAKSVSSRHCLASLCGALEMRADRTRQMDLCDLCGGKLELGQATLEVWYRSELVVVRDIPADVCQQCREAYIAASVSEKLDRFLAERHRYRSERFLAVPQYSAAQLETA